MFPDSEVAKSFSLLKDKTFIVINFGLSDFFREEALTIISKYKHYVSQFGESL